MSERTDLDGLARHLAERHGSGDRLIVAIAGPPGVGKSTISEALRDAINHSAPGSCEILPMDGYHFDDIYLNKMGWRPRKGAPFTFDVNGFRAMLARIQANEEPEISVPVFDRDIEIARAGARMISSDVKTVIVEGNYLLLNSAPWDGLRHYFDTSVMLTAAPETLETRLLARWTDMGLSPQDARQKASGNDLPNVKTVVENSIDADFVINTDG